MQKFPNTSIFLMEKQRNFEKVKLNIKGIGVIRTFAQYCIIQQMVFLRYASFIFSTSGKNLTGMWSLILRIFDASNNFTRKYSQAYHDVIDDSMLEILE